jgi:acyl carrier protein
MPDREILLMRCFASAFPSATPDDIKMAKTFESIPGFDSLRMVTLLAVLGEQFGVDIDLPEILELETFDAVSRYLSQRGLTS